MMIFSTRSSALGLVVCFATFARSAPAVTNATLLQSAQEAQALNAQFLTLTTSSPCGNLTTACVANAISNCENDAWVAPKGACSKGTFCFATPNLRGAGTILQCTSNKTASSIIEASGASGGITGLDTTDTSSDSSASASASASATPTASDSSDSSGEVTVTVTVTQPIITGTVTTTSTQTVSPDQASSIISSLIAAGGQAAPTATAGSDDADNAPCTKTHKMSKKHGTASAMATSEATAEASATDTVVASATASASSDAAATEAASADSSSGSGYY